MSKAIDFAAMMEYTAWERGLWREFFAKHPQALALNAGPNGDGRFTTVGDLVKHIFSAEKRYVERLNGHPLSDFTPLATTDADALFAVGAESRQELEFLVESLPPASWEIPHEFKIMNHVVTATPKKIVAHTLMHEIRHWAQIATICRMAGHKGQFRDLLVSPVFGGGFRKE